VHSETRPAIRGIFLFLWIFCRHFSVTHSRDGIVSRLPPINSRDMGSAWLFPVDFPGSSWIYFGAGALLFEILSRDTC
jgi:hypothetical protein